MNTTQRVGTGLHSFILAGILLLQPAAPAAASHPDEQLSPAIPGEYIVVLKAGADPAGTARRYGVALRQTYSHALRGFSGTVPPGLLRALENDPAVLSVEPDVQVSIASTQIVPTGVSRVGALRSAIASINGIDQRIAVDVAILDTGIDLTHPDLHVVSGVSFVGDGSGGQDGHGHGTHVAGTVGALDNNFGVVGVAPGVRLWAVKVLDNWGYGTLSGVIAGVDYVTRNANQIAVANMSLAFRGKSDALRAAIQNSVAKGVVYVVAAANSASDVYGPDGLCDSGDDFLPAAYPEVMTVSALMDTDGISGGFGPTLSWGSDDTLATFSNFSRSVTPDNPVVSPGGAIDLAAPGGHILSTSKDGSYATMSGTSMAAPHVAGAVALHVARYGRASNAAEVAAIRQHLILEADSQQNWGPSFTRDGDGHREGLLFVADDGRPESVPFICLQGPFSVSKLHSDDWISFVARAFDYEDGEVCPTMVWHSGVQGELGRGGEITAQLAEGSHTITVSAANSRGIVETTSFEVTILPPTPRVRVAVSTSSPTYVNKEKVRMTVTVHDGAAWIAGAAVNLVIEMPNGKSSSVRGITDAAGRVLFEHTVNSKRDGIGTYQIRVSATHSGFESGSAGASFLVTR
jgi:subtilisin